MLVTASASMFVPKQWKFSDCRPDGMTIRYTLSVEEDDVFLLTSAPSNPKVNALKERLPLRVLLFFIQTEDPPFTREQLIDFVWPLKATREKTGSDFRTFRSQLSKLRNAFEDQRGSRKRTGEEDGRLFITVHGRGFRFGGQDIVLPRQSLPERTKQSEAGHASVGLSTSDAYAPATRLDQFGTLRSLIALALKTGAIPVRPRIPNPLIQLLRTSDPDNASEVCKAFVNAPAGAEFQFQCVTFFETFLHRNGTEGVKRLQRLADAPHLQKQYKADIHRLEALPVAAAAHLLSATSEDERGPTQYLSDVLVAGMRSKHPQVIEITFQNLIAAAAVNPDVRRYFKISKDLLGAIDGLIHDQLSPEYLGGLCSAMIFLLNLRLLHVERREEISHLDKVIQRVLTQKGSWAWYVKRLIQLHGEAFKRSWDAPPYLSECCFFNPNGMKLPKRAFFEHIALIYAKLFHAAYSQANGTASGFYDKAAARRSYGKAGASLASFPIGECLFVPGTGALKVHVPDLSLARFLPKMPHILEHDENIKPFQPDETQLYLTTEIPFVRYQDKRIALEASKRQALSRIKNGLKRLDATLTHERALRQKLVLLIWLEIGELSPYRFTGGMPDGFTVDEVLEAVDWAKTQLGPFLRERESVLGPYGLDQD